MSKLDEIRSREKHARPGTAWGTPDAEDQCNRDRRYLLGVIDRLKKQKPQSDAGTVDG